MVVDLLPVKLVCFHGSTCTSMVSGMRVTGGPPAALAASSLCFCTRPVGAECQWEGPLRSQGTKREKSSRETGGMPHGSRLYGTLHNFRGSRSNFDESTFIVAEGHGGNQKSNESRHSATRHWTQSRSGLLCGCGIGVLFSRRFSPAECKTPD